MTAFPELTEQDFGSWQTDLYVVAYPHVVNWLKENYQFYDAGTTDQFISQTLFRF